MPSRDNNWLCLRPLSGGEADIQLLCPALEREPIRPARFSLPEPHELATQDAARLLSEALRLSFGEALGRSVRQPAWLSSRAPISLCRC